MADPDPRDMGDMGRLEEGGDAEAGAEAGAAVQKPKPKPKGKVNPITGEVTEAPRTIRKGKQTFLDKVEPEWVKKARVANAEDEAWLQCHAFRRVRKIIRGYFKRHDYYHRNPPGLPFIKNTPTFFCFCMLVFSIIAGTLGIMQPNWANFQSGNYQFLSPRSKSKLMFGILSVCQTVTELDPSDLDPPNSTCSAYKDQDTGLW